MTSYELLLEYSKHHSVNFQECTGEYSFCFSGPACQECVVRKECNNKSRSMAPRLYFSDVEKFKKEYPEYSI